MLPPDEERVVWRSCCLDLDRQMVKFFAHIISISTISGFSIYMLIFKTLDCNDKAQYFTMLGSILAHLLTLAGT
jgi:hypothetical protein